LSTKEPKDTTESKTKALSKPKGRVGRPKKADVAKKKQGNRGAVGRPKGDAAIMNEYKSRMLTSPKSRKVLDSIFNAALDDDHKNQAAAWKLVMDRVAPSAMFEQEVTKGQGKNSIQINITGLSANVPQDIEEAEFTEVSTSDSESEA
tara:strand:- start:587 stop:1030 length:444 start_codon:yes stop_codon:yes gene_type:complete